MYEALKGMARRTTQSMRERSHRSGVTEQEAQLIEMTTKVRTLDTKSRSICERVIKVARLMEELGNALKEIGEEYEQAPDLVLESRELAQDVHNVGTRMVETSQEHQKGLKDKGFDVLHQFNKHCAELEEVETRRRNAQLEHDFFLEKVLQLRKDPPKDVSRIPRNEHTLESWRVELWQATESNKALLSSLYTEGRRAIDMSVLTTVNVLHSFVDIASTGFKQTFFNARLPEYPDAPALVPTPLPPNPLPPFQPPTGTYGYTYIAPSPIVSTGLAPQASGTVPAYGTMPPTTTTTTGPITRPATTLNATTAPPPTVSPAQPGPGYPTTAGTYSPSFTTQTLPPPGSSAAAQPNVGAYRPATVPYTGYQPPHVPPSSQPDPYTPPPT